MSYDALTGYNSRTVVVVGVGKPMVDLTVTLMNMTMVMTLMSSDILVGSRNTRDLVNIIYINAGLELRTCLMAIPPACACGIHDNSVISN